MSTSPARLEANRLNSQKSTGPRTEEGRSRSAQNARTHGLTATTTPQPIRSNDRFQALASAMRESFAPTNILEEDIVERIIQARWNLFAAERMISAFIDIAEYPDWEDAEADPDRARARNLAAVFVEDAKTDAFSKMLRYRNSSQRQFDRARKELEAFRETNPIEEQPVTQQVVAAQSPVSVPSPLASVSPTREISVATHPNPGAIPSCA
jgi:hypothetical protein